MKHIKLVKPFTPHVIACNAWSVRKDFNQSICRTKEQKTRLQYLASAMPKAILPSAAKKRKGEKVQEWSVLAKTPPLEPFFQQKFKQQR